jgi:hypothetical protein
MAYWRLSWPFMALRGTRTFADDVGEPTMWSFGLWHSHFAHRAVVRPVVSLCLRLGLPVIHQENHFYPGTNMFVSFFPGFHKASQDVLGNLNCPEIT